ncbi:hypothetical protein HG535_0B00430 [Zygotorulaspora mrakii]|uniref:Peroxisomal membrane protein PEX14-like KPWE domain-containing protein n=1 Tax=Zygotorulaspora mrakii TaxID=42260 RepID=A0A7H9AXA2_ZYGMR|nr:uncharacterized protein HG535_0B00430 [Zygotorulaspora mrakii]QLG71005.1 hypothetical protein HG535_0B00430 [Zygotorulaspora mrakii]
MPELSYEEIIDHIVSDKPLPNVVAVPDVTLCESLRTVSEIPSRPKPWEIANQSTYSLDGDGNDLATSIAFSQESSIQVQEEYDRLNTDVDSSYYLGENELDAQ